MRFNKSLAAAGALGLAVLTASPALADTTPTDAPSAPAETQAPAPAETKAPAPAATQKPSKPAEQPKPSSSSPAATQKPAEAKPAAGPVTVKIDGSVEPLFGMSTYEVKAGGEVTADVVGDLRAGEVIFSSDLFGTKHMQLKDVGDGKGRATFTFPVAANAKAGSYAVRADLGRFGKPTANLKVVAPSITEPRLGMSGYELKPGETVTVDAVGNLDAGEVIVSSDAFPQVFTRPLKDIGDGLGRATFQVTIPKDAKPATYPVRADFGRFGKAEGTFKVVSPVVEPVPVTGLNLQLEPGRVAAGQSYFAGVTTKNVKPGTPVTVTDPGGKKHVVKLDPWGTARVRLTVPKSTKPGSYSVVASLPGGQSHAAKLTVLKTQPKPFVHLVLDPNKVYAGGDFNALVFSTYHGKNTTATVVDPGGKKFTVKIGKAGVGVKKFHVPSSTKAGEYWFQARLADGQKSWAKLTVKAKITTSSTAFTPRGGAETGGGLVAEGTSGLGGVALGGFLLAGGAGTALFARRRPTQG
ncbi:hypothetical protein OIE66_33840 [Nonomuraea sp. NBC_01738]|uniref:hypothetical protein n=1 Tax=Nonomuraea sp. NBC_01738 TaxID=2976003 RepID=UPI002E11A7F1|nr:hypothetical protein OIE66_33840 [Nonomuraea sp. NBC_01738]